MSNKVEVDTAGLNAEVDRIVGGIPPDPAPGPTPEELEAQQRAQQAQLEEEQAKRAAERYLPGMHFAVEGLSGAICPNWELTTDEKSALAANLATAFGWWVPNINIHPRYLALGGVVFCMFGIAKSRKDPATGKVKPMRVRPVEPAQGEQQQGAPDATAPA